MVVAAGRAQLEEELEAQLRRRKRDNDRIRGSPHPPTPSRATPKQCGTVHGDGASADWRCATRAELLAELQGCAGELDPRPEVLLGLVATSDTLLEVRRRLRLLRQ